MMSVARAAVDDPAWVRERYDEAKSLVEDLRADLTAKRASLEPDLVERVEDFCLTTFMDRCTTMGLDCGCNQPPSRGRNEAS